MANRLILPPELEGLAAWLREMGFYEDETGYWRGPPEPDKVSGEMPVYEYPAGDEAVDRCRKYVATMPVSVSGSNGHDAAWMVAQVITRGFALSEPDGWPILCEFSERCVPPWTEKELRHKIEDAAANSRLPLGYIVGRPKPARTGGAPRSADSAVEEDDQPAPVFVRRPNPAEFPIEVFPEPLRRFALEVARAMSCPVDFPALAMLVMAASAVGNVRALNLKRGWSEGPRFYLAIVAPPGSAKSPAVDAVCRPVFSRQRLLSKDWRDKKELWQFVKDRYDSEVKRGVDKAALSGKPGPMPAEPHIYTTDCTTEVLIPILQTSPRGLVIVQDEISGWVLGMNQYKGGKGNDRQFYLSTWSGGTAKRDRSGKLDAGSVQVPHAFVNILGGIQPDMLDVLCDEQARQDGFVHRILFGYPDVPAEEFWTDEGISEEAEETWVKVLGVLFDLDWVETDSGGRRPYFLKPSENGKRMWVRWYNEHQAEVMEPTFPENLKGPWSKLRAYCARLALTVHYLRFASLQVSGEIDDDSEDLKENEVGARDVQCAAALIEYFKAHARRVYHQLHTTKEDALVLRVCDWLEKREGQECKVRDLIPARFTKKSTEGKELIKDMADRGLVNVIWKDDARTKIAGMRLKPVEQPEANAET